MQDQGPGDVDLLPVVPSGRLLHSDPHDFAGLYIRHRGSFTLHARRYLRDARDADEVVQEAFLRLFLALPELETELQALAYCRRTITNLCIDRYRAQARRPSLVDLDSAGALDLAEDDPGDPVVRAEDAATVRDALSLLSPLHRAALVKREIEEKPLPVIAAELEIPEDSVKHVLFRARRALRRILAGTSLAPGSDAEIPGALGKAARAGSGGVAVFLLMLVLGLGTGPDLRAIPVVGSDLPDLIPVTGIADAVGSAVGAAADGVVAAVRSSGGGRGVTGGADGPLAQHDPLVLVGPTPSPTASPSPNLSATPVPSPAILATPSASPTAVLEVEASPGEPAAATPTPVAGLPSGSPSPTPSPSASDSSPKASASPSAEARRGKSSSSPSPSPSPMPSSTVKTSHDPTAYQTDGLEYVEDPETGQLILVPLGATAQNWRS